MRELVSLDWLQSGKSIPPRSQLERIKKYQDNRKLFYGDQSEVFREQLNRIKPFLDESVVSETYPVVFNYNRLITLKTVDLICGEPPEITAANDRGQETLDEIMKTISLNKIIMDVSRMGDSVVRVFKGQDGKNKTALVKPDMWYPVIDDDTGDIMHHVIIGILHDEQGRPQKLRVQIHSKGSYEQREYAYDGECVGGELSRDIYRTGLSDFAIVHFPNVTTSDSMFGVDDYTPIDSIMSELMVRVVQVNRILDKHAAPSMQGPDTALQYNDKNKNYEVKAGNYFINDVDDGKVEYLTWDGNISAAFTMIEKLLEQLYIISEMGGALLGAEGSAGQASSGTALRLRMINPLVKAKRISRIVEPRLKHLISLVSEIGYRRVKEDDISIDWFDGLPDDSTEVAQTVQTWSGATAASTRQKVAYIHSNWSDEEIDEEVERIMQENGITVDNPDDLTT